VSDYLQSRKLPCLWYQVDEGDSDIATFFYYMNMATKKAAPRKQKPLPLFTPEYAMGIPVFTRRYFENLYSRFKAPFVLVFDNYQDVQISSEFHKMINYGLDVIPEGVSVIGISRKKPPSMFTRLLTNNGFHFLGWDEIRFTIDESRELVQMKGYEELTDETLFQIYKKTEGWVAGLVLILKSLEIENFDYHSLERLPPIGLFDYFKGEIFEKRDRVTQEFLLKTSFLHRMTPLMAEKMTGMSKAGLILSELNRDNYFTEKRLNPELTYQYHPMFREFLIDRAKDAFTPSRLELLKHEVATLLEADGQIENAIGLLRELGDILGMIRLIHNYASDLMAQGRSHTLERWLTHIPGDVIKNTPWLLYWKGVCRLPFKSEESQVYFEKAFQAFKMQGDISGMFLAWSGVVESIIYGYEGLKPLDRWLSILDELLKEYKGFPAEHIEAQATCSMVRALAMRRAPHINMNEWVERLLAVIHSSTNISMKARALINLACYRYSEGDLQRLEINLNSLWELMQHTDIPPLARLIAYWLKAAYLNVTSKYDHCQKVVSDGLEYARTTGIHVMDYLLMGHGVLSALKAGNLTNVKKYLQKMASTLSVVKQWQASFYHYTAAWEALYSGNPAQAHIHSEQCVNLCEDIGDPWSSALAYIQRAYISNEFVEYEKVTECLTIARSIGVKSKNEFIRFICSLTEAYFLIKQGKEAPALTLLQEGLQIGKERGYVNLYMWQPDVMETILAKALEEGIEVTYAQNLVRRNAIKLKTTHLELKDWPWVLKLHTLGRFGLLKDNKQIRFIRKTQQKPLTMLKALIAFGERDISKEQLNDLLWPEAEGDAAHSAFSTTLSRLRHLLDVNEAIRHKEGRITLDPRCSWVDAWAFERLIGKSETLWRESQSGDAITDALRLSEKAIDIYKGLFLPADERHSWTTSYRERLRNKFLRINSKLGNYLQQTGQWEEALECYQRTLEVDDLAEEFYQNIMLCNQRLGRKADAVKTYQCCREILSSVFGIEPSSKTETIYQSVRSADKRIG